MFENFEIDRASLPKYILIAAIIIAVVILNIYFIRSYISSNNEIITDYALRDEDMNPSREAAVAGLFYPADVYQLQKDIDNYLEMVPPSLNKRPHILIVPHAGYLYSAKVAAHAYQKILPFKKQIKKVFLLGPSHRVALNGVALSSAKNFKTPLGETPVSKKITAELAAKPDFAINDRAHRDEHALEVQLPFLQKTLDKFSIVPMVYGRADPQKIAAALTPYLQKTIRCLSFRLTCRITSTIRRRPGLTAKPRPWSPTDNRSTSTAPAARPALTPPCCWPAPSASSRSCSTSPTPATSPAT